MAAAKANDELLEGSEEQAEFELHQFHEYNWKTGPIRLAEVEPNAEIIAPAPTPGFVRDLKKRGQLEAITVSLVKGKAWRFKIMFGRRRVLAARQLGWKTIQAVVVMKAGEVEALLATIASNRQRALNPMAEVDTFRQLEKLGVPAALWGASKSEIKRAVALSKMEAGFQTGIRTGLITPSTAEQIQRLAPAVRKPLLKLVSDGQKITAKMVHDAKRTQVSEGSQQLMAKLSIPAAKQAKPAWQMYIVFNPTTGKGSLLSANLLAARNRALADNNGAKVFRLVEV